MNGLFNHLKFDDQTRGIIDDDLRSLMFGDYMSAKNEEKSYNEVVNTDLLREVIIFYRLCNIAF